MIEDNQRKSHDAIRAGLRRRQRWGGEVVCWVALAGLIAAGCTARIQRHKMDKAAYGIIAEKQFAALNGTEEFNVETPADTLRRQLLLDQQLPLAGPESLGSKHLVPVEYWPEKREPPPDMGPPRALTPQARRPVVLSLNAALQAAAHNSREYQDEKESVFRTALALDLARDQFRTTFAGLIAGIFKHHRSGLNESGGNLDESFEVEASAAAAKQLKDGSIFTLRLGWNLLKLLEPDNFASQSVFGDASVEVPLLRGAGEHIAAEPLTQAEREALYAIYAFERFKRAFAVRVAREYLAVLESSDRVKNAEENYRGLIASTRRARRLFDAGDLPPIQVDQSIQDELDARNNWISARETEAAALDVFKALIGLPTDGFVELDRAEFEKLSQGVRRLTEGSRDLELERPIPPADAPILLKEPSGQNAGPFELEPEAAVRVALHNRLDLRIEEGRIYDAQRSVVVAANQLWPELTFFGRASLNAESSREFSPDRGDYDALLTFDPGFERTAEAVGYRASLLDLEQATRAFQELEDEIKFQVRERLRTLREARETLQIQNMSVDLARRRVRGADLNLQAGRVQMRDLLEAQEDLLSAQNALTSAAVDYRLAELELQRDLDVLEVGADGLWNEFNPTTIK